MGTASSTVYGSANRMSRASSSSQVSLAEGQHREMGDTPKEPQIPSSTIQTPDDQQTEGLTSLKTTDDSSQGKRTGNEKAEGKQAKKLVINNVNELEKAIKPFYLPRTAKQSGMKLVKDYPAFFKNFKTAVECVFYLKEQNENIYLDLLQDLNLHFFELDVKDRIYLGDFLSHIDFCKASFTVYKSILKTGNMEYFNDTMLALDKTFSKTSLQALFLIRSHWWNFSDASTTFGNQLAAEGVLQELVQDIINLTGASGKTLKFSFAFESGIGTLHNIAKLSNLRQTFRDLKFVDVLGNFLNYEDQPKITMLVLMTLALIIDEDQTHLLTSHDNVFHLLVHLTKQALKTRDHRFDGFSAEELLQSMTGLSRNDNVKKALVEKGVLSIVLTGLNGTDEKEIEQSAKLLWELSFDPDNKIKIKQDEELMAMVNKLTEHSNGKISKAAQGVNLVIDMGNTKEKSDGDVAGKTFGKQKSFDSLSQISAGHVMISYNWSDQKRIIEIKDVLQSRGYKIWMDIDNIKGSTLQAMAEAVEQADVVLVCMSERYKESPNCRSEAEYAFSLQKPLIPLLMQLNYKPNGWLGILLGTKLFFNFSGKYPFEMKMEDLVKEIGDRGKMMDCATQDNSDGAIIKHTAALAGKAPGLQPSSQLKISDWISQNNLTQYTCLQSLTSDHLQFLKKLSSRAPEFYYSFMMDLLSGKTAPDKLTGLMMVSGAIEKLPR